jgi:membrane protease YdiL (CAAX protease family)
MSDDSSKSQRTRTVHWGPLAAIVVVVLSYLAAQVLGSVLVSAYTHARHWSSAHASAWLDNSVGAQFLYVVLSEAITVGVVLWFLRRRKGSLRMLGLVRPKWRDALLALAGMAAYFGIFIVAISVLKTTVHMDVNQQQEIGFDHVAGVGALVMTFISLVVLPPFVEETVFRGFLYTSVRSVAPPVMATLATSALFALPHLLESGDQTLLWIGGVDTFVLSLVLCYLREKTGRLWAGIGVHALKNGLAYMSLFILHMR